MKRLLKLSDEEILRKYKQTGKKEYFAELYGRYIPLIYGVFLKYLRDVKRSQNSVVQLFETLIPMVSQQEIEMFRPWIYSVVKNSCQADSNLPLVESLSALQLLNGDNEDGELKRCMKKLPVEQRIAIIRFFMEDMSYQDIVSSMGYELGHIKNLIRKGIQNLEICTKEKAQ